MKKILILLGLAAVAMILILTRPEKPQALSEPALPQVRVTPVAQADVSPTESVSGRLQTARRSELRFEVGGRVVERRVEPGQRVAAGELLLALDDGDFRDAVAEAEAQLALEQTQIARDRQLLKLAQKNAGLQRAEVKRLESLTSRSMVSASQLDDARIRLAQLESEMAQLQSSVDSAEARLALRRSALDKARRNLERSALEAPFGGMVNEVDFEVGDYAAPGQRAAVLIDPDALDFYAEVRGEVARALALGQEVEIRVGDRDLTGTIQALQEEPDPSTFTHAVKVRLSGEQARPGQTATARFPLESRPDALVVPVTAVLRDNGNSYVFRVEGNRLVRSRVQLGLRLDDRYIIKSGVPPQARIVARDVAALSDGQQVEIIRPADTAEGAAVVAD